MFIRGVLSVLCGLLALSVSAETGLLASEKQPNSKRVLIIGVDGTRIDTLLKANTPHLDELIRTGAFTDTGDILGTRYQKNNTISGPSWSSILTGVWADKHGVHDNHFTGKNYELFPHFFKRLKRERPDVQTVSLVSWAPIHEHILSEADIAVVENFPKSTNQPTDLRAPASKLNIDTRDGNWHHLLATRQGGELRMYLDGQLLDQLSGVEHQFDLEGDFFHLGRDTRTGDTRLTGDLSEVQLWKRALSAAEIQAAAKSQPTQPFNNTNNTAKDPSLLLEFRRDFSQAAGSRPYVVHFNGDQAETLTNAKITKTSAGEVHEDLDIKVRLTESLASLTQGDFTVAARFRTTDPGRHVLLGNYSSKAGALNLELHTGNSVRVYFQPPNPKAVSNLVLEDERDQVMAQNAARILREENPHAMFVYFHQTDATGHTIGFSPDIPEYVRAIENVDGYIGTVLEALKSRPNYPEEDWLVIVCTDHGGIQKTHSDGHEIPEIRRVFVIVNGPSAQPGKIEEQFYLVDVAATALTHLLGHIDKKWQLDGKAIGLKQAP